VFPFDAMVFGPQQSPFPLCTGGQTSEPNEQKTQQSPVLGRMTARQAAHWWKKTQASVGIDNVSACPQCGQCRVECRIGVGIMGTLRGSIASRLLAAPGCLVDHWPAQGRAS
jgi:hypothetical protein